MSSLLNIVKQSFGLGTVAVSGGVHPPEHKHESTTQAIGQLPLPSQLTLPLRQHVGNLPKVLVKVGDRVLKGQLLAEAEGNISAAIHAPSSGVVTRIEDALIPHPSGLPDRCITIALDGKDEWITHAPIDWRKLETEQDKSKLLDGLRSSGIVGLGGAAFPTQVKLRTSAKSSVDTLVLNAAECEPYITCDDMLMRERADQILKGLEIAQHLLGAKQCLIGIEDNKPEAAEAMRLACANSPLSKLVPLKVVVVPTQYPSGDARQLIRLLTGIEVPADKRSTDVGLQCFNVATVLALHRYFDFGEPSIDSYIMGGPMMGFNLPSVAVPITKASNCVIASAPNLFPPAPPAMPCIRCARCADVCPVSLQPQELYWFAKSSNLEKARDYNLFDCIECGCCTYACPSNIPLVQYYRFAKSEIIAQDRAKEAADLARERNEFRLMRIEREKQERAEKHAQKAAGAKAEAAKAELAPVNDTPEDEAMAAKKAAIAAAIERAKAQKAAAAPQNVADAIPAVQAEIAEIDARRKAAKQSVADATATNSVQEEK
ncbi:electron transport complex subunit RsxC [Candidatus Methylopumilus turicensis]|uniref:Ion-translocating oxidoreductase complex subunit C n=1 Tax=Candidatus Methylopumilus turicensis TaxID=1581680 RepID=A0A0B7J074_9PROT|nr:electron transport complex subunit RsxC [Candidatus Methylopumilus turicensis]CEN56132.1 Electron transport complex protein RnfC [Candidatus Methylopumilus turicensis]